MQHFGLAVPGFQILHVSWLINGNYLAFVGIPTDGRPSIPILGTYEIQTEIVTEHLAGVISGLAASPRYDEVALVTNEGIRIFSLPTDTVTDPIALTTLAKISSGDLVWSPNGQWLAVTGSDPTSRSATHPLQQILIISRLGTIQKSLSSTGLLLHLAWAPDCQQLVYKHVSDMHVRYLSVKDGTSKVAEPFAQYFYPSPRAGAGAIVLQHIDRGWRLVFKREHGEVDVGMYLRWEVEKPPQCVWWSADGEFCLFYDTTKHSQRWHIFRVSTLRRESLLSVLTKAELTSPTWSSSGHLAFVQNGQILVVQPDEARR